MIKKIALLILLVGVCQKLPAQVYNVEITYKLDFPNIVLNEEKGFDKLSILVYKYAQEIEYKLIANKEGSVFEEKKIMDIDTKTKHLRKMAKLLTGVKGIYHFNLKDSTLVNEKEFDGVNYLVYQPKNQFKWILLNEKKLVGDYTCYKARTEFIKDGPKGKGKFFITAWYCPELPFPSGPKNFSGLPGLILELHEEIQGKSKVYRSTSIKFNVANLEIKSIGIGEKISQEEYEKLILRSYNSLMDEYGND